MKVFCVETYIALNSFVNYNLKSCIIQLMLFLSLTYEHFSTFEYIRQFMAALFSCLFM